MAQELGLMLDEVQKRLQQSQSLSKLEEAGALHALQVLTENAIGKAKVTLKSLDQAVPISGYDAFAQLGALGLVTAEQLRDWTAAIGLRNRIVHEYLNMEMLVVKKIILERLYQLQVDFLVSDIPTKKP